jgi:exosortase/archaeosortase
LIVNGTSIHLISACIAGAAYYLLLILNLTTPMKPNVRFKSLLFLFAAFLVANILRIVVFSVAALNSYSWFGQIHALTWYLGSTIFVVCLWFINVRIFRTKSIPIYTDFKSILKSLR